MNEKVMIKANKKSNLLNAIISYMESEKIEYIVVESLSQLTSGITKIIYVGDCNDDFNQIHKSLPLIMISNKKKVLNQYPFVNYIITTLIEDCSNYTDVQKEYLFKKGIYHIFIEKLSDLLENTNAYNGMIYDLTEIKTIPDNWIFSFDSINDTYHWLLKKNKMLPTDFVRKIVNFYDEKVYDDSLREINYLTEKLKEIKEGKRVIDIFICNKEELKLFQKNYFFTLLLKNISSTYQFYIVDKDNLLLEDNDIALKLMDGVAIYNDCIYRDTYDDEFSLGYVDCNESTIYDYNKVFDYVLERYGKEIKTERDLDEF